MKFLSLSAVLFFASLGIASPIYTPTRPVLNPYLTNAEGTIHYNSNLPSATKKQLSDDLNYLFRIKLSGESDLHHKIFGGATVDTYKIYFLKRVDHIEFDPRDTAGEVAYAGYDLFKIDLTLYYTSSSVARILRLALLLHEARHMEDENGYWLPHANCPVPFKNAAGSDIKSLFSGISLAGHDACDDTVLGGYGTSIIFLENIARFCMNCDTQTRRDAHVYAMDQLQRITKETSRTVLLSDFRKIYGR